tara:strand:+ start:300 stop:1595 length:1296 start_codon:yes stop_codon:yes gene_type:complete
MKLNKKNIILITISLVILIIILITAFDKYEKYKNKTKKLLKVETLYYSLKIDRIKIKSSTYGGIDVLDKKIIYLDNNSGLYSISEEKLDNKKFFNIKSLSAKKIENFKDQFIKSFEDELGDKANALFGVKDILIGDFFSNDRKYLLASSLKFNKSKNCYTLNLFLSEILDKEDLVLSDWSEVYASSPCLKVDLTEPKFAAASAGGRIFKYDNQNVLLTIGDFYSDDVHGPALSQNLKNDYGKIIKINLSTKQKSIFSYGHRNPQGLFINTKRNIFSSEHGPAGGDEINLILEGKNYGWPLNTFGVGYKSKIQYGEKMKNWPPDVSNNTHAKFEKPIFSWGNTFAASNLIYYEGKYFDKWKDNLIVGSLATKKLARLVINDKNKSIILKEDIKLDVRIRDIIQLKDGKIAILTDPYDGFREIIIISKIKNSK